MKFEITLTRKINYEYTVEADNEDDAEDKAYEFYEKIGCDGTLSDYYSDEDTEIEVYVEE